MNQLLEGYSQVSPHSDHHHGRLLEEIAYLEARLIAIGQNGDCAYEKVMERSYRELLLRRRQELATIQRCPNETHTTLFLAQSARYLKISR